MFAVGALKKIAEQLGKKDWNFELNPCDENNSNWKTPKTRSFYTNEVTCNCSFPNEECHVDRMYASFPYCS